MLPLALFAVTFIPMLLETARSARNERALRAMGAIEPRGDVYRAMQVLYPACFLAMMGEAWLRHRGASLLVLAGAALFVAAKALKYWAVASLGVRWSFRVLVPPASSRVLTGPYRFLTHPNYVAVVGEIAGMALMAQAPVSGIASVVTFSLLILARIRVEERALGVR
jgi:methyltransferase